MSAKATQIWNGFTNPNQIDKTQAFTGADFLVLNAFGVGLDNFEIAATVAITVEADTLFLGGLVESPAVPLGEKELPLDITFIDTAFIALLPDEATRSGCKCTVYIATSYAVNLEVYAVRKAAACDCQAEFDQLKAINLAIAANQVAQDVVLLGTATVIGAGLALPTGGASLSLSASAAAALTPAAGALIPLLRLTTGIPLPI